MREKVQIAVAGDVGEAEEMRALLSAAGIDVELETGQDDGLTLFVAEDDVAEAQDVLDALVEPGEPSGDRTAL